MPSLNFEIRDVEGVPAIYARAANTPVDQLGPTIGRLLGQVGTAAAAQGTTQMAGPPFCRYTDWRETVCDIECGMPIAGSFLATDSVHSGTLGGGPGTYLCYSYFGSYDKLHASYEEAEAWMTANGYTWDGPPWDSYITDPMTEPDTAKWQTDIFIPVQKSDA